MLAFAKLVNLRVLDAVSEAGGILDSLVFAKPERRNMAGDADRIKLGAKWRTPPWDVPPWEMPGGFRLDAKPHRGPLLRKLANAAFICSALSYYPFGCFVVFCIVESWITLLRAASGLALFGSGLGLIAWVLAARDLKEMQKGLTNPEGKWETIFGRDRALLSVALGLGSFLLWASVAVLPYVLEYFIPCN